MSITKDDFNGICNDCGTGLDEVIFCSECGDYCVECYEKNEEQWFYDSDELDCRDLCHRCSGDDLESEMN